MKKEELNELLKYTRSKKVLRTIFLYNNEDLLKEVINIYEKLCNTNRTDSQKSDFVMMYIKNRKNDRIKDLICSSLINDNYTFEEHKKLLKQYISQQCTYEQIINESYMKFMNLEMNEEEKKSTKVKTNSLILNNKNVLNNRSNKEINKLLEIYSKDETGHIINIIVNKDILENRNNYEQIKLLNLYSNYPTRRVYNLITNPSIVRKKTLYEQLKLIDIYLDNPNEVTYSSIIKSIDDININLGFSSDIINDIESEIKIYKQKKENK